MPNSRRRVSARRRALPSLAGSALAALLLGGCALKFDAASLGVPVTFSPATDTAGVQRFSVTSHAVYGLWGIASLRQPSLQRALAAQLVAGSGVTDLHIRVRSRWSDVLVTVLTGGLVVPRAVTFEGAIVGNPPTPAASPASAPSVSPSAPAPAPSTTPTAPATPPQ